MGKKRRLNKFISKWIKSDLPEDRTTVLLLGVTRIPTSPPPVRRPCSLPLAPNNFSTNNTTNPVRRTSSSTSRRSVIRRNSSKRRDKPTPPSDSSEDDSSRLTVAGCPQSGGSSASVTPSNCVSNDNSGAPMMERSVDSIGTCSLDVEASADLSSDWSEASSVGTLRSASLLTPPPATTASAVPQPHLPSYLSLACTINGYSTTTNYDPIRLARSRDVSPHRLDTDHLTQKITTNYSVQNNLLSPPNLVPLPTGVSKNMAENTFKLLEEFYSSTILSKDSLNLFGKDGIDGCLEKTHHTVQSSKSVSFEKNVTAVNGQSKCTSETTIRQEFTNGVEQKSFIQQRVERLYGPGALAQGFFVTKRQMNRTSESDSEKINTNDRDDHSKSLNNALFNDNNPESSMKQSFSSPTLPVLRHLRPEFRAQLPIMSSRKGIIEGTMQKSVTVPKLKIEKDEVKTNGHSKPEGTPKVVEIKEAASVEPVVTSFLKESGEKNGHYFLKILDGQAKRLLELADRTENYLEVPDLSEEVIGIIRSASGKARLLVSQKMQQFKGLCTNNINQNPGEAFPTTNEDLQGFWDMVMLQVHQVDALFEEINVLRNNKWKEITVETVDSKSSVNGCTNKPRKVINRARPTTAANEEARKAREASRKQMIEDRRKAMKAQQNKQRESIEIFVPESS